jgi:zinc finger CCCH domain-containing protein 13
MENAPIHARTRRVAPV